MKLFTIVSCAFLLFSSCNSKSSERHSSEENNVIKNYEKLEELTWLLGAWTNSDGAEFSKETWRRKNDSTLSGFSFTHIENDTVFAEELLLTQQREDLFLTVVAYGQNNDSAVTFTKIPAADRIAVFENRSHDFPQRIVYSLPKPDSIHAWVEGSVQGKFKKIDFYFNKEKGI